MPVRLTQTATVLAMLPNFYLPISRQNANCSNTHTEIPHLSIHLSMEIPWTTQKCPWQPSVFPVALMASLCHSCLGLLSPESLSIATSFSSSVAKASFRGDQRHNHWRRSPFYSKLENKPRPHGQGNVHFQMHEQEDFAYLSWNAWSVVMFSGPCACP